MLPTSTVYIAVSVGADLFYVHNLFTYFNLSVFLVCIFLVCIFFFFHWFSWLALISAATCGAKGLRLNWEAIKCCWCISIATEFIYNFQFSFLLKESLLVPMVACAFQISIFSGWVALSCVSKAQGWEGCCFYTLTAVRVYVASLPNFIPWGSGYESVYYGINNTRPIYSERAHRPLQNPQVSC